MVILKSSETQTNNNQSYPAFEVAIEREGKSTLFVNCMSNDPNANIEEREQEDDAFEVISMAVSDTDGLELRFSVFRQYLDFHTDF